MRWAVTGSGGQLGRCLVEQISAEPGETLVGAWDHASLDVTDEAVVDRAFAGFADAPPDALVNAAAFTKVDRCESEPERAMAVNADAPARLAWHCGELGIRFVHVSTDYVFDGRGTRPYRETDPRQPHTAYGRSKAEGERHVLDDLPSSIVVRTSWVFGPGRNFVAAILEQAQARRRSGSSDPLRVVDDQRGSPTYAGHLARGIREIVALAIDAGSVDGEEATGGLYHLANGGEVSWWDFARRILDVTGHDDLEIERISTESLALPADRPRYSVLDCSRASRLGVRMPSWREGLDAYLTSPEGKALLAGPAEPRR